MSSVLIKLKKDDAKRLCLFDTVRGACVIGMVIYHTIFDIVATTSDISNSTLLYALNFIRDFGAALFIFIAGVCFHFGKARKKRFLLLFISGLIVTLATYIVMPECTVIFGVLTFMSIAEVVMLVLDKPLKKMRPTLGLTFSIILFLLFFRVNYGYIGTYNRMVAYWPQVCYKNYISTFFGFPFNGFSSGDYFSILPWIFIYFAGYFSWRMIENKKEELARVLYFKIPVLYFCGKYSLYIYLLHQPIIFGIVTIVSSSFK